MLKPRKELRPGWLVVAATVGGLVALWAIVSQPVDAAARKPGEPELDHFMISSQNECPTYSSNATARTAIHAQFDGLMALLERYSDAPTTTTATTRLAYFKTHKTGSSTMHAVMINFARKHGLVPVNSVVDYQQHEGVHLGCPDVLRSQPATQGAFDIEFRHLIEYRIFTHLHAPGKCYKVPGFFSRIVASYEWLIAGPGTPIVTTFREPVSQFLSSFGYFTYRKPQYDSWSYENALVNHVSRHEAVFNMVAKDFGFNPNANGAAAFVKQFLASDRVLVVVLERLMESLVVMRRSLGWDFVDVLHLVTNEAGVSKKQEKTAVQVTNATLMDQTKRRIATEQEDVDEVVYRAALAQLDRRVAALVGTAAAAKDHKEGNGGRGGGGGGASGASPCFAQEVLDLQWAVDTLATLCGCSEFLQSEYVSSSAYRRQQNSSSGSSGGSSSSFDLVSFCDSFDEQEVDREIGMTHEHNAEVKGAALRATLGADGMKALNFDDVA
jgi:hypothetical protein